MKLLNLMFKRETAAPVLALGFASVVSVLVIVARMLQTGRYSYGALIWNLFLAWLPLIFALMACEQYRLGGRHSARFAALVTAWLLFFPNAPYIFTDLIHLRTTYYFHFWVDLVLILMCAFTGMVIGFLSLYLMQHVVAEMFGRAAGWVFTAAATVLGSFGIFLGRFLRFNSWDVVMNPARLLHDLGAWTANSGYMSISVAFPVLFSAFLFTAYVTLYALTHLSPARLAAPAESGALPAKG